MGVPALFRWLSKKYPKIVAQVIEDTPSRVRQDDGEIIEVPIQYESENPNGFEVDNLYLDMNGIVHPCTHPEGKPAPATEEEMMLEIFNYTERVVNMARPRRVLIMAIDGVAPRAKMNQQRSRRFRAAQEAADKEEERKEAIKMFEAMGHPVSEETRNHKSWDSNAITPGTPFMDLLSSSLKYWVSQKLTNDPGWKDLKVIISDASVPGEGEHKIVDWIRRQRTHPEWNPNTRHAIYGLDADLIMLALATHEPHFRVLREDVFAQGSKDPQACRNCGKTGHFSANCKSAKQVKDPNVVEKAKPVDLKPFIWLDVACLREYLAVELNLPQVPFAFDLELAIDDWIFMIFFVGNDFLPHLPSLEIREGAIDTLLKIWRTELPRMGGYLTNHGRVNLERAQVILDGLASREDEIFQRRKEDEDRQNANAKRRRIEDHRRQDHAAARENDRPTAPAPGTMQMNGQDYVSVTPSETARGGRLHPSLPQRPGFDIVPTAATSGEAPRPGKKLSAVQQAESLKAGLEAMGGSNLDVVKNRKAIRMANMSAAQALKAELEGGGGPATGDDAIASTENGDTIDIPSQDVDQTDQAERSDAAAVVPSDDIVTEEGAGDVENEGEEDTQETLVDETMEDNSEIDTLVESAKTSKRGRKRKANDEVDDENDDDDDDGIEAPPNPEDQPVSKKKLKVNPDGTVDYDDTVRLWEPGYRERYYRSKFGIEISDTEFIKEVTRSYMEGLCWVLEYYYQGVPAWDWFYPYHFAPFAQDFRDVSKFEISFEVSMPFKPFAQLLGVFPAASRIHLPAPLQPLMIEDDSPIIDFYPSDFEIDMNGKKMAWQGVALLPFIDQKRLLDALKTKEDELSDDEKRRNSWGDSLMFIAEHNDLFDAFCSLYTVKAATKPVPIDANLAYGMTGSVLADPMCVPNSTLDTPIPSIPECPDLESNAALSVRYYFPRQVHKHRSVLLRGFRPPSAILTESDKDWVRRGGQGGGGRGGRGGGYGGGPGRRHPSGPPSRDSTRGPPSSLPRSNAYPAAPELARYGVHTGPPPPNPYGGGGYGGGAGAAYGAPPKQPYGGGAYGGYAGMAAPPPSYGGGYGGSYPPANTAYGGYGAGQPRNPYAPPPNPYGAPPPSYGGGAYGGSGQSRGGYNGNPYGRGGPPPRRY